MNTGERGAMARRWASLRKKCGEKCVRVLDDCGVFKDDEEGLKGFLRFLESIGYQPE